MGKWSGLRIAGAILIVSVLFVVCLGWFVSRGRDRDFNKLQTRIEAAGGRIYREPKAEPWLVKFRTWVGNDLVDSIVDYDGYSVTVKKADAEKEQLADLLIARPIRHVYANGAKNLDDEWLARIRDPLAIRSMKLSGTEVTDRSVETILEMKELEELDLCNTTISDEAVDRLRHLPRLQNLYVGGPNIKAVRLLDLKFLDSDGRSATRSGGALQAVGRVRIEGLSGKTRSVGVTVTPEPDVSPESVSFGTARSPQAELGDLVEESPGNLSFQAKISDISAGRSTVEVLLFFRMAGHPVSVCYHMSATPLQLTEPISNDDVPTSPP